MHCDRCQQPLIKIDRYGEQLIGCIECNCWRGSKSAFVMDLSIEEIQALRDNRQTHSVRRGGLAGD
jgi:hypothetical protein